MRHGTLVVALLAALAFAGGLWAADEPTKKAGDNNAPSAGGRGQLPPNFKKLGLTDEQTAKIREIHASYRARMAELEKKVRELRKQELAEEVQVLTDGQKERLKELAQERATGESTKGNAKNNGNKTGAENKSAANSGNANKNEKDKK